MSMRLTPIEKPRNPLMKLAYWVTRRRVGTVITPLKTIYARLPFAFAHWMGRMQSLEKKLPVSEELRLLSRIYVAQLNTCSFCIDIGQAQAIHQYKKPEKFFQVQHFEDSPLFAEPEKAALRLARELTIDKKISDSTFQSAQRYFSEQEIIGIAWMVTSEHVYNLMNGAFEIPSDGLCSLPAEENDLAQKKTVTT